MEKTDHPVCLYTDIWDIGYPFSTRMVKKSPNGTSTICKARGIEHGQWHMGSDCLWFPVDSISCGRLLCAETHRRRLG